MDPSNVNQSTDSRTRPLFMVFDNETGDILAEVFDNETGDVLAGCFRERRAAERFIDSLSVQQGAHAEILTIRVKK